MIFFSLVQFNSQNTYINRYSRHNENVKRSYSHVLFNPLLRSNISFLQFLLSFLFSLHTRRYIKFTQNQHKIFWWETRTITHTLLNHHQTVVPYFILFRPVLVCFWILFSDEKWFAYLIYCFRIINSCSYTQETLFYLWPTQANDLDVCMCITCWRSLTQLHL